MARVIASVLFPLALPKELWYSVDEALAASLRCGMQVTAPLGTHTAKGIVVDLMVESTPNPRLKALIAVETHLPVIGEATLRFWEWIAQYYLCQPGLVAKMALPSWRFRRTIPQKTDAFTIPATTSPLLLKGIPQSEDFRSFFGEALQAGCQCLLLCPDAAGADYWAAQLHPLLNQPVFCFHAGRSSKERNDARRHLYAGKECVVIGLHLALFLPFTRLGLILLEREHHPAHKRKDALPHLHNRDAALMLGQIHHARVVLSSATPTLETEYNLAKHKYRLQILPSFLPLEDLIVLQRPNGGEEMVAHTACPPGRKLVIISPLPFQGEETDGQIHCTPMQSFAHLTQDVGAILLIHAQLLLGKKNFRAQETAYQMIASIAYWAQLHRIPFQVYAQDTSSPFFEAAQQGFPPSFITTLLQERASFLFPPTTRLISITFRCRSKNMAENKAAKLHHLLVSQLPTSVTLFGPFPPQEATSGLLFSSRLLLVVPRQVKIQEIKTHLKELLPSDAHIDVDPL